jgi:glycosyltransferase involved in cell wall biosynthesis
MALGVPQIFANVGGQNELITPETGILIENGSGEETRYAQACLHLLSAPSRWEQMAESGKERMRLYLNAETAVNQYAEIFARFAAAGRKEADRTPHLDPPHIQPLYLSTV